MARATLQDAREVTASIVQAVRPQAVIVFGEVCRSGNGSDLDLLILVEDQATASARLDPVLRPFFRRIAIDPFLMASSVFRDHFRTGSPFLRTIIREGRLLYMENAESTWLKEASEELNAARFLAKGRFWKMTCFHCQQAMEKWIKGRLIGKGWELERVHSLARLVSLAADFRIILDLPDNDVTFIDTIYRGRYPGEAGLLPLGEPTEADAHRALAIAETLAK
jgi:HEPN domain-containing protein